MRYGFCVGLAETCAGRLEAITVGMAAAGSFEPVPEIQTV
jgi:hypothetical protein